MTTATEHLYIVTDDEILSGEPIIKGTRIPVAQILSMLANGDTIDSLLLAYLSLEREDGLGCVEYAASLAE